MTIGADMNPPPADNEYLTALTLYFIGFVIFEASVLCHGRSCTVPDAKYANRFHATLC